MNRTEFLKAFSQLSGEEQQALRAELAKTAIPDEPCCTPSMKEQLAEMMKQMEASSDPMAMCREMMRMCCQHEEQQKACK